MQERMQDRQDKFAENIHTMNLELSNLKNDHKKFAAEMSDQLATLNKNVSITMGLVKMLQEKK